MEWHIFPPDNMDSALPAFMTDLKGNLSGEATNGTTEEDATPATARRQLYAHTKKKSKIEMVDEQGTFWDRNFGSEESIAWFKFQQAFLSEYETNISETFDDTQVAWLLDMLKNEVFEASETDQVTHAKFVEVRGSSEHKGHFWKVVSDLATEKYSMNEVFNMESTVRLTAVENLGKFSKATQFTLYCMYVLWAYDGCTYIQTKCTYSRTSIIQTISYLNAILNFLIPKYGLIFCKIKP